MRRTRIIHQWGAVGLGGELCGSAAVGEGTQPLVQSDEELWHGEETKEGGSSKKGTWMDRMRRMKAGVRYWSPERERTWRRW